MAVCELTGPIAMVWLSLPQRWMCCLQVERFEKEGKPEFTPLVINLTGVDPDDAYSVIPYEKGSAFLFYLEKLLGGPGSANNDAQLLSILVLGI